MKVLYDKLNKRTANVQWFIDEAGNYWVGADPFGVQMSGNITIAPLEKFKHKFEIREIKPSTK